MNSMDEIRSNVSEKENTIALDFDGVIHSYKSGWTGDIPEDPPMPGVEEAFRILKAEGYILKILSTRNREYIKSWLEFHNLDSYISGIYNSKIPARMYIDDRGIHFSNWREALIDIENFKKG
jgi:phosphoglycolate phosphatase-like HAD superfamily hydrolase